jgi:hypothetical protein
VFLIAEGIIVSGAAMDLADSVPSFGAGTGMWAVALALISAPTAFPPLVRLLGFATSLLFAITAIQIFAGAAILPTAAPLPFYIYPIFVATMIGWIITIARLDESGVQNRGSEVAGRHGPARAGV